MARQKGVIKIQGSLGNVTFYRSLGQDLGKEKGGPSRERIFSDPKFKRTRENLSEFGAVGLVVKGFRAGLKPLIKDMGDPRVTGRMMKLFREILKKGNGIRGRRPIQPVPNKELLIGFNYHNQLSLDQVLFASYTVTTNAQVIRS